MRYRSTNIKGNNFGLLTIASVWEKGMVIPGFPKEAWRYDSCGNLISRSEYGNINSQYGWEIDHIKPVSKGGNDDLYNLQPLQWTNNRSKGDTYPNWSCSLRTG